MTRQGCRADYTTGMYLNVRWTNAMNASVGGEGNELVVRPDAALGWLRDLFRWGWQRIYINQAKESNGAQQNPRKRTKLNRRNFTARAEAYGCQPIFTTPEPLPPDPPIFAGGFTVSGSNSMPRFLLPRLLWDITGRANYGDNDVGFLHFPGVSVSSDCLAGNACFRLVRGVCRVYAHFRRCTGRITLCCM